MILKVICIDCFRACRTRFSLLRVCWFPWGSNITTIHMILKVICIDCFWACRTCFRLLHVCWSSWGSTITTFHMLLKFIVIECYRTRWTFFTICWTWDIIVWLLLGLNTIQKSFRNI
jgi:hypothetical protein